ncbi:MAG: hypothetical protein ACO3JL_10185 [Myxococcota bacterium]
MSQHARVGWPRRSSPRWRLFWQTVAVGLALAGGVGQSMWPHSRDRQKDNVDGTGEGDPIPDSGPSEPAPIPLPEEGPSPIPLSDDEASSTARTAEHGPTL